ncbi:MAG TPA: 50S ribosomal protein L23 [Candidatus Saccharimonadales bacterium]|nr:50S ribosomal protein L23 [Candidatus Saccharimonadales bacterium]
MSSAKTTEKQPAGKTAVKASKKVINTLTLKPRMSEKAYGQSQEVNTYAFDVPKTANKVTVARAVAAQFDVKVENVRIAVIKGKQARSIRIGGSRKIVQGKRPDIKKAYVRIKAGESIPVFASIEEAEKKAKKAEEKAAKTTSVDETPKQDKQVKPKRKFRLGRSK